MRWLTKSDQAFHIMQTVSALRLVADALSTYADELWFGQNEQHGIYLDLHGDSHFRVMVKRAPVYQVVLLIATKGGFKSLGEFPVESLLEFLRLHYLTSKPEAGDLPPFDFDELDLRYLGELTGQDFIGFYQGDRVKYVPNHAKGPTDSVCETGVVSLVEGPIGKQKVWVKYGTGDTGQLTPVKNLVRL